MYDLSSSHLHPSTVRNKKNQFRSKLTWDSSQTRHTYLQMSWDDKAMTGPSVIHVPNFVLQADKAFDMEYTLWDEGICKGHFQW